MRCLAQRLHHLAVSGKRGRNYHCELCDIVGADKHHVHQREK